MIDLALIGLVVVALVLSLLAVGASTLLIPSHIFFTIRKEGSLTKGGIVVKWLGIRILDRQLFGPPKIEVVGREKEQRRAQIRQSLHTLRLFGRASPYLFDLFKSFFTSASFEGVSGDIKLGLEDPVDTAVVYGFVSSMVAVASVIPKSKFVATPVFGEQVFDGSLNMELRVTPFRLVVALTRAYRNKPVRDLFREMRRQ